MKSIYVVAHTLGRRQCWPWVMVGIAIVFNPIFPISFEKEEWQPIDFATAVVFLIVLIQSYRRRL